MDKKERFKNEIEDFGEINSPLIVCPYCFEVQKDTFEIDGAYEEGYYEYMCQYCNKEFEFETIIDTFYTTKPIDEKT